MGINPDLPYALKHPEEVVRRRTMLTLPHVAPLLAYTNRLVDALCRDHEVPFFDPCDGGVEAEILFLLEPPGRKAMQSGFVSRNNPDPSAKNMCALLSEAGLPRKRTVLWNIVPWYVGTFSKIGAARRADIEISLPFLRELIDLLSNLKVVVLVGGKARSAKSKLIPLTSAKFFESYHPSLQALNRTPERRPQMLETFKQVRDFFL